MLLDGDRLFVEVRLRVIGGVLAIGQNLDVTAGGNITQAGAIVVPGTANFTIDGGLNKDVLLAGFDNDFATGINVFAINGGTVRDLGLRNIHAGAAIPALPLTLRSLDLQFPNATIVVPTLTLSGNLNVQTGGPITQSGPLVVAGTSSFDAGANPVSLTDGSNLFTLPLP